MLIPAVNNISDEVVRNVINDHRSIQTFTLYNIMYADKLGIITLWM